VIVIRWNREIRTKAELSPRIAPADRTPSSASERRQSITSTRVPRPDGARDQQPISKTW